MILKDVIAEIGIPDPSFIGIVTNDDNILAIDISKDQKAKIDDYAVVQGAIEGVDAQVNATTSDKTYLRAGLSSTKTGTQRTFKITGDRHIGDEFQDYALSLDIVYGVGEKVVVPYVWFNALTGKGETGKVSIMVNSDGSGKAGETAGIDIELKKTGGMPAAFAYPSNSSPEPDPDPDDEELDP